MTLIEENNDMEVEVFGVPADLTVINMKMIGSLSGLKDGEWKQRCDYLIVREEEGVDHAVFVELKRTLNKDKKKALDQLRRSVPFLEYFRKICELHFTDDPIQSEIALRYVMISERISPRLDKQPVKPVRRLPSEEFKNIMVTPFVVRSRIGFDGLWSG